MLVNDGRQIAAVTPHQAHTLPGEAVQRLLRTGTGINKTAATVGVGTATVQRIRAEMGGWLQTTRSAG